MDARGDGLRWKDKDTRCRYARPLLSSSVRTYLSELGEAVDLVAERLHGLPRGEGQPGEGVLLCVVDFVCGAMRWREGHVHLDGQRTTDYLPSQSASQEVTYLDAGLAGPAEEELQHRLRHAVLLPEHAAPHEVQGQLSKGVCWKAGMVSKGQGHMCVFIPHVHTRLLICACQTQTCARKMSLCRSKRPRETQV